MTAPELELKTAPKLARKSSSAGQIRMATSPTNHQTEVTSRRTHARVSLKARLRHRVPREQTNSWLADVQNEHAKKTEPAALLSKSAGFSPITPSLPRARRGNDASKFRPATAIELRQQTSEHQKTPEEQWTQYMTLSQVHQILKQNRGNKFEQSLPDIKIRIASVPKYYPNIKVTLDKKDTRIVPKLSPPAPEPEKRETKVKSKKTEQNSTRKAEELAGVQSPRARGRHGRPDPDGVETRQIGSLDKTRAWILNNPLGPEENPEYNEDVTKPRTSLKRDEISRLPSSAKSKKPSDKKVRFSSLNWHEDNELDGE